MIEYPRTMELSCELVIIVCPAKLELAYVVNEYSGQDETENRVKSCAISADHSTARDSRGAVHASIPTARPRCYRSEAWLLD